MDLVMEEWAKFSKQNANKRIEQACRWGFKPFICEMRLREYKSTLIDKSLNYFISVKLLILETIVSQRPWFDVIGLAINEGLCHETRRPQGNLCATHISTRRPADLWTYKTCRPAATRLAGLQTCRPANLQT